MSGPIVRKYGFPNFDQIFGKKELQHGVEDEAAASSEPKPAATDKETPAPGGAKTEEAPKS